MTRRLRFTKMQGLGNDFVVLDGVRERVALAPAARSGASPTGTSASAATRCCSWRKPRAPDVDFRYRIFNADGGEVEQCGNGARCFVHFVRDARLDREARHPRSKRAAGVIEPTLEADGQVTVDMGPPRFAPAEIPFVECQRRGGAAARRGRPRPWRSPPLSMGNPHAVQVVADVEAAPVPSEGPQIERHERFRRVERRLHAGHRSR